MAKNIDEMFRSFDVLMLEFDEFMRSQPASGPIERKITIVGPTTFWQRLRWLVTGA